MGSIICARRAAKTVQGSHVFKISGYSLQRERLAVSSRSAVFTVGGYDWQIHFFPGGVIDCCKDYVAAYVFLESKNKDISVRASFQLSLVDVTGSAPPRTLTTGATELNTTDKPCAGLHKFMKRSELEGSPYLRDDHLTIECVAEIAKAPPPSDIVEHLGKLLREKDGTDVVLEVEGDAFPAHKIVLAMRSPVFKAELYGAMRAKDMSRITISDMHPAVFEVLLHFIYNDSLPAMDDLGQDDCKEIIRHLLVAADRYAMERLKIICESILCENIDVKTAVPTWALAGQHQCGRLNDGCVQFIWSLSTTELDDVIASQGYAELKATCPLAVVELWEMTRRVSRSKSSFQVGGSIA
ncbi:BTB/POZ and MATH domain-containing protein 2-like [Triticum aestivum]|uniref:BTB/POZ and MATH domain-containing protein 2-like n=1 Tax=Triticum aestivum TaxID=4565 RepID=UPI001D006D0F|nr:BTB/POZ and MATH domain-containing protein 2-like [Triticum aestivum]